MKHLLFAVLLAGPIAGAAQVVDKVVAVIGKYPVLLSDIENSMLETEEQGVPLSRCKALEILVYQKLLVSQADKDSVTVTDAEVDTELNRRMAHFIQKFGSEEKLEKFYGKRTNVLKDELRAEVQEQLLADKMEGKVKGDIKVTPAEVRQFYSGIPEDSLPYINSEVELQQLVKKPTFSHEARMAAREALESYRQRVITGQSSMSTLARLYSEDPGSAKDGGFIPNVARGTMEPAFEAVAFRLKTGEVSHVFETSYGYHFIELVQRRGDLVDLRHILVMPKMTNEDFFRCKSTLDSLYAEIKQGTITFEEAVRRFSDDAETKQNAGLMVNPQTASTRFDNEMLSQIDPNLIVTLNNLQVGDISKPMQFTGFDGKPGFRILRLKNRIDPHRANLKDDYQRLSNMATASKLDKMRRSWIRSKSRTTYIHIDPAFACPFDSEWTLSN